MRAPCERRESCYRQPLKPLQAGRADSDKDKLLDLYDEGHEEGAAALEAILNMRGDWLYEVIH